MINNPVNAGKRRWRNVLRPPLIPSSIGDDPDAYWMRLVFRYRLIVLIFWYFYLNIISEYFLVVSRRQSIVSISTTSKTSSPIYPFRNKRNHYILYDTSIPPPHLRVWWGSSQVRSTTASNWHVPCTSSIPTQDVHPGSPSFLPSESGDLSAGVSSRSVRFVHARRRGSDRSFSTLLPSFLSLCCFLAFGSDGERVDGRSTQTRHETKRQVCRPVGRNMDRRKKIGIIVIMIIIMIIINKPN